MQNFYSNFWVQYRIKWLAGKSISEMTLIADHISTGCSAVTSVSFHSDFWTEWPLTLTFCMCMDHDHISPGIEGQAQRSKVKLQKKGQRSKCSCATLSLTSYDCRRDLEVWRFRDLVADAVGGISILNRYNFLVLFLWWVVSKLQLSQWSIQRVRSRWRKDASRPVIISALFPSVLMLLFR